MRPKRYRVTNGVLRFENGVTVFEDYLTIPDTVHTIDFNEVQHILKPFSLRKNPITMLDFKKVLTVSTVLLPDGVKIKEQLYWADHIVLKNPIILESPRMKALGIYSHKELIYLSGSVKGYLATRTSQMNKLLDLGYGVYSPGNHMTFGDPVADNNPQLVADIDIFALEKCDVIFFDLTNLSAGTCAELGYAVAKEWYKTKRLYYMIDDSKNFFINGIVRELTRVNSIEEFGKRDKDYGLLLRK